MTRSKENVTTKFHYAFIACFIALICDFFNSGILMIYYRFRLQKEEEYFGVATLYAERMAHITCYIEVVFHVITATISIYQFTLVHSKVGEYCVN